MKSEILKYLRFNFFGQKIGLVLLSFILTARAQAQLTTIAYDGFNYSAGSLSGQNGGTGWASPWVNDYGPGTSMVVSGTDMTYSGLTTSGGSAVWTSGGVGISEDSRSLSLQNSGSVYLQFLCQFGPSSGLGTPTIRLLDDGNLTGGFGANGGTFGGVMSILDPTLQPASDGSSSSSASLSGLNLVVALFDYQDNTTEMWVNPDLSTFDYLNPSSPDATADFAPTFDNIAVYTREPGSVDEIQIMSVPEPAAFSFLGLGVVLWKLRKRLAIA
jgi:hypothetical protein